MRIVLSLFFWVVIGFHTLGQAITNIQLSGPSSVTAGQSTQFTVTFFSNGLQVAPPFNATYYWFSGGGTMGYQDISGSQITFFTNGTFTVYYEVTEFGNTFSASTNITVSGAQSPCPLIVPSAPEVNLTSSEAVTLTANPAPSGFSYQWFDSNQTSVLGGGQTLSLGTVSVSKTYYLAYYHLVTGCMTAKTPVRVNVYGENLNWVREYQSRDSISGDYHLRSSTDKASYKSTEYHDGLGRSIQTIQVSGASDGSDIISTVGFDGFGRQFRDYLPFPDSASLTKGKFRTNAVSLNSSYYASPATYNDTKGYADKTFEASPLNRVKRQGVPGIAWNNRDIKTDEEAYLSSEEVRIWTVDASGLPVSSGSYPTGALTKYKITDENFQVTIEYKDKLERVILKKVQAAPTPGINHTGWLSTYYIYDSFGRLRVVMPPKATELILAGQSPGLATIVNGLYYLYSYDERGRMITKKLPDKSTEEMVYDLQDRLVAWRDANLAGQSKWLYTKYDALGRVVMTGLVTNTSTRATLQATVNTLGSNNAIINSTSGKTGTTNAGGFPRATEGGEGEVLTVNYYDGYTFRKSTLTYLKPNPAYHNQSTKVHGLPTGKLVRNLGNGTRYETAIYYDDQGRVIQTMEDHHLGGTIRSSTRFDFENKPIETITAFSTPGTQSVTKNYYYNKVGLIDSLTHRINTGVAVTLAKFTYDRLGKLSNKTFPVAANAAMNFKYNIRGWITEINNPQLNNSSTGLFAQELFYAVNSQFNGNIEKVEWKGIDNVVRLYAYTYDPANRLQSASYQVPTNTAHNGRYDVGNLKYDANGNIETLRRFNQQSATSWGLVDSLTYSYASHSNMLANVFDNQTTTGYVAKDFKNLGADNYGYDANGNLIRNSDKQISSITYNHLNLPRTITFSESNKRIDYWYNAEGVKVRQVNTDGATVRTFDYLGEFVFENNAISYILHDEGRASFENSVFRYEFFVKDHLGNVRQVVRAPVSTFRIATMEPEKADQEEEDFANLKESRQGSGEHNKTPGGYATAWLNAERGRILGPSRTQEVQAGDSLELSVYGKYVDPKRVRLSPATFARTGLDRKIIRTLGEYGQNLAATPNEFVLANVIALVISEVQQKPVPEAYMGYALYDEDSNRYEVGKILLSKDARNKHEELIQKLSIQKDGYIETFLVNETSENVWFDQFRIMSTGPLIVQETHYDPWGVELSGLGYQYGGIKVNPYLYNGKEANGHLGVNLFDYGARMYDAAIGRWFVVDPLADYPKQVGTSPYAFVANNPLRYIDPTGMIWEDPKQAEKLNTAINNRIERIDKNSEKIQAKIDQGGLSDKKLARLEGRLSENSQKTELLNQSLSDIEAIGNAAETYRLTGPSANDGTHGVVKGADGVINIEGSNTGLHIHEIRHVGQSIEAGGVRFNKDGRLLNAATTLEGARNNEINAYQTQYSFDGSYPGDASSLKDINSTSLMNIKTSDGRTVYEILKDKKK